MALTVSMPQLGESVTEGTIARWLKQPGDPVARYESIVEVASDKVNAEIPAPVAGTFGEIIAAEGSVVSVGQPICTIEQGAAATAPAAAAPMAPTASEPAAPASPGPQAGSPEPAAAAVSAAQASVASQPAAAPQPTQPAPAAQPTQPAPTAQPVQPFPLGAPTAQSAQPAPFGSPTAQPAQPAPFGSPAPGLAAAAQEGSPVASAAPGANGAVVLTGHGHVTPAVRMLLREHGVDVGEVAGSGIGGRVTKKDVLEYVQRRDAAARAAGPGPAPAAAPAAASPVPAPATTGAFPAGAAAFAAAPSPSANFPAQPAAAPPAPAPAPVPVAGTAFPAQSEAAEEGDQLLPMTSVRRTIADHMVRSRQTSPHAWLMVEVDMSRVVRLRERSRAAFKERYGISLTYLPFVARAVVEALQRRPTFNAQWSDAGLVLKHDIHLGIAVALEENLVVPVLRNADRLSVAGLAQAMTDLGNRARANRLKLDEIQGGTFTLNNTGALGAVMTQAIINQPQAAILTMDAVVKRPVVIDDMIAIRPIMNLGMSFDHRINDGLQAARFLQDVKGQLEGLDESATLL